MPAPSAPELPDAALLALPGVAALLSALRGAVASAQPERELTALLARLTGGFAEIRASWGDVVASAGRAAGPPVTLRLSHGDASGERHVGTLTLAVPGAWAALAPVAAEYALLARLQSAAAGAARRRVGERTLDALLSGTAPEDRLEDPEPVAVAVAALARPPAPGAVARHAQAHALDVLAAVGEGYFLERGLAAHSTVRGERAVWLWHPADLEREAQGLHAALTASTARDVRLGVSGKHPGIRHTRTAEREARHALAATRQERAFTTYHAMDPLYALLAGGALSTLRDQVRARLALLGDGGRVEATLRAYLGFPGPLPDLARRLNIHVNTLRYRLRRAEEALGGSLHDPALLARLYLAFEAEGRREEEAGAPGGVVE
ncbi:regulatory protein of LrpR family [Deinococcus aerius]|uniref:Regulatory protein of LrpR family n=1 Tax=Deinococcus aerius TaxID=200253 RepID=A0A2I9CWG0_9DEIO|nr:helix-turn-helix domain-containing protein [Deinococcus aerius]GBF06333.1 regulatory protein of LrpR family [Deinococcus aerius]